VTAATILEQANLAVRIAREEPARAAALATEARAQAVEAGLPVAESAALRALGLAARASRQINAAIAWLEAAVEVAERASELDVAAEARVSLASALAFSGDTRRALDTLDGARPGEEVAVIVASNRIGILTMLGRYDEALGGYEAVINTFRHLGDRLREARALTNRGLLYVYTGRFRLAEPDLARAEQLATDAGHLTEAAGCCHNRGFAAARKGDLPAALAFFDRAERRYAEAGRPGGALALDRGEALLAAGLVHDARTVVGGSLAYLRAGGDQSDLAEGLVLLANIALLAGNDVASRAAAVEAAELFTAQARPAWTALAQVAVGRAGLARSEHSTDLAATVEGAADELDRLGLRGRGVEAHAVAGELWLALGQVERAHVQLAKAALGRRGGTAGGRLVAWEAEAVRRLSEGDRRGALAGLRAGLAVVDAQQASLGATELRAHVSIHADRAARLGLRLVLESGRPRQILTWMERRRANSLRAWPVRPPRDDVLIGELAELRALSHDTVARAASGDDIRPLLRRQADLERAVRERAWQMAQVSPDAPNPLPPSVAELAEALGDRALVELADSDGVLHAVVLAGGRCSYRRLGPTSDVLAELSQLRFGLRRLAYNLDANGDGAGVTGQLRRAEGRLDELVLGALRGVIGARAVVIVPTGELHATPWAALPTLAGRATAVAPSARAWLRAAIAPRSEAGHVVIVSGPRLSGAPAEARALGRIYPGALVLGGSRARAATVVKSFEHAEIAHVAAHASFRVDNGLWSALQLADGPLTVYDLEGLEAPPGLVVLSACQSGLSTLRPGDEVLGLVAALLGIGTRTVIASVLPVEDTNTVPFMVSLHRHLRAGLRPATALAAAQATSTHTAVAASFVCFGAG
jgi:tetratricopeptide (TPR) repeat protein